MKLSEGVEWGAHCAVLLSVLPTGAALPAGRLAEYHEAPVAYLAKHLQAMSRAGILEAVPGPKGGYRLARPATEITLLEVVEAIDSPRPPFRCTEIRHGARRACRRASSGRCAGSTGRWSRPTTRGARSCAR